MSLSIDVTFPHLTPESVVLDIGAYHGAWSAAISAAYNPWLHLFEPVPEYAELARSALAKMTPDKATIHQFGLGAFSHRAFVYDAKDGSSFVFENGGVPRESHIVRFGEWLSEHSEIGQIALMKLNIEGGEYDLLDSIIGEGLLPRIDCLLIQFHEAIPRANERYDMIVEAMKPTHKLDYRMQWLWERWSRR